MTLHCLPYHKDRHMSLWAPVQHFSNVAEQLPSLGADNELQTSFRTYTLLHHIEAAGSSMNVWFDLYVQLWKARSWSHVCAY